MDEVSNDEVKIIESPSIAFTSDEIQLARDMKTLGVDWTPTAGHFVLDEQSVVHRESPFQKGVFFVLNYEVFMKIAEGPQRFRQIMTWLPVWHDCRTILRRLNVSDGEVIDRLLNSKSFDSGTERLELYRLIVEKLRGR